MHNLDGKQITYLGTGKQGGGFLRTNNRQGTMTSYLGEGRDSRGGHLQTYNMRGQLTSYLGTNANKVGALEINNEYGIKVGSLTSTFEPNKYSGDGVLMLHNNKGEYGWMKDGTRDSSFTDFK